MTIREFVDRLMLELGDVRGEKLKLSEYFIVATEALKTVEAVYAPLFDVYQITAQSNLSELVVQNSGYKKYFKVGRLSETGRERYIVDYEYAKVSSNTFLPVYGAKIDSASVRIALNPPVQQGRDILVVLYYVHDTAYFTNEANEIEMPENYVLIALNIAKQYLYTKYGVNNNIPPILEQQQTTEQ